MLIGRLRTRLFWISFSCSAHGICGGSRPHILAITMRYVPIHRWARIVRRSSGPATWDHCSYAYFVQATLLLHADMIFGKDRHVFSAHAIVDPRRQARERPRSIGRRVSDPGTAPPWSSF